MSVGHPGVSTAKNLESRHPLLGEQVSVDICDRICEKGP